MHPEQDSLKSGSGTLYVVATPIGNLRDISLRALDILKTADLIAAEDTRNSAHLLAHYGISSKLMALHEHNERVAAPRIIAALQEGKTVALVSDAGTPGISDPGAVLVQAVRAAGLPVIPLPGANAAICALSASGRDDTHFLFYGFLSSKASARRKELETLREQPYLLVFYEAPHRIMETVDDLFKILGGERDITFARELTKMFESIHTCKLADALGWLTEDPNRQRGEFVLLVSGAPLAVDQGISAEAQRILQLLLAELPLKQAVKLAADISGEKKNALYDLALRLK